MQIALFLFVLLLCVPLQAGSTAIFGTEAQPSVF